MTNVFTGVRRLTDFLAVFNGSAIALDTISDFNSSQGNTIS
ncbi:hypothetical protein NSTCB13_05948 [Nostoc sp. DSM 114160]|jgi:hypothetical protein